MPVSSPLLFTTGASLRRLSCKKSNACRASESSFSVNKSLLITVCSWVNRSTPAQSSSVTIPRGLLFSTITTAPCARFDRRLTASATVCCGDKVSGVSKNVWRDLTHLITLSTTSNGISCGITARPPRRAIVSAIRRPDTAVIFATTSGIVVPDPSCEVKSTSMRDASSDLLGTMKTSS